MDGDTKRLLARRVRALREAHGWSQRDLGKRAGVAQKTISNMENVDAIRKAPKLDIVEKVARALGCDLWKLLMPDQDEDEQELLSVYRRMHRSDKETLRKISSALASQRGQDPTGTE